MKNAIMSHASDKRSNKRFAVLAAMLAVMSGFAIKDAVAQSCPSCDPNDPEQSAGSNFVNASANPAISFIQTDAISAYLFNSNPALSGIGPFATAASGTTGLSSGDAASKWSGWASVGGTRIENDFFATRYNGHTNSFNMGADYKTSEQLRLGVSLGYMTMKLDTAFNGGGMDASNLSVIPYLAYRINDTYSVDASLGYIDGDNDQNRINAFAAVATGSQSSSRWVGAVNLNAVKWVSPWLLSGKVGLSTSREKLDGFTESDGTVNQGRTNHLDQFRAGARAAYVTSNWMPYAGLTYTYDLRREKVQLPLAALQPSNPRDSFTFAAGLTYFTKQGLSLTLDVSSEKGRDDLTNDSIMLTGGMVF